MKKIKQIKKENLIRKLQKMTKRKKKTMKK